MERRFGCFAALAIATISGLIVQVLSRPVEKVISPKIEQALENAWERWALPLPSETAQPSTIPLPGQPSIPVPTAPPPQVQIQQVRFAPGNETVSVSNQRAPDLIHRYLVNVRVGQVMAVSIAQGDIQFDIRYPDGTPVENSQGLRSWEGNLPESGDFQIDVWSGDRADYTIEISVTGDPI